MTTELETMIPPPVEITAGGKTITLKRIEMDRLLPAIQALFPVLVEIKSGELKTDELMSMNMLSWLMLYAKHGKILTETVAYLSGVSVADVGKWSPDEMLDATSAVVRANHDFFGSLARAVLNALATITSLIGPSPASDS